MRFRIIVILLGSLTTVAAQDAEPPEETMPERYEPEKQESVIDRRLAEYLPSGQIKWLGEGDSKFLARSKTAETGSALGNIVIVPAPGKTIDAPGYVRRAMDYFPTVAWHVMAISTGDMDFSPPVVTMPEANASETEASETTSQPEPMLADETEWYEQQQNANQSKIVTRVNEAIRVLPEPQKGYVLVASSASAHLLIDAIKNNQLAPMAVVFLDISHPVMMVRETIVDDLVDLTIPTLDIYQPLENDAANLRRSLTRSASYEQKMVPAINADYVGVEDILLRSIRGWLKRIMK